MRRVKLRAVGEAKAQIQVLQEAERLLSSVRIPFFLRQLGLTEPPLPGGIRPSLDSHAREVS
jgi:hypothetical protein